MISLDVVYEQFLSTVKVQFPSLDNNDILQELYNWTVLASAYFKFPRVDLTTVVFTEDAPGPNDEVGAYFVEEVTQSEITVIIEYLKYIALFNLLSDSSKYDMYYQDANLKLPSGSALAAQLNKSVKEQLVNASRAETNYYRAKDNRPTIGDIWTI